MPATGRERGSRGLRLALLPTVAVLGFLFASVVHSSMASPELADDRAGDLLATINHVATALADGNPSDAMKPFDKSFRNYERLSQYFTALTDSSDLNSEVEIVDEQDSSTASDLTVQWTLTLAHKSTFLTDRRSGQLRLRLVSQSRKWKIADLSPVEFFDPQPQPNSK